MLQALILTTKWLNARQPASFVGCSARRPWRRLSWHRDLRHLFFLPQSYLRHQNVHFHAVLVTMATRSLDHVVVVNFGINKVKSCMKEAPSITQVASTLLGVSVDTMPATTY